MLFRKPLAIVIRWLAYQWAWGLTMGAHDAKAKMNPVTLPGLRR